MNSEPCAPARGPAGTVAASHVLTADVHEVGIVGESHGEAFAVCRVPGLLELGGNVRKNLLSVRVHVFILDPT